MSQTPRDKDRWDKLEIIGKGLVTPVLVALIGFLGSYQLSQINHVLGAKARSVDVMTHFLGAYYREGEDSRRLSVHSINLIEDHDTRNVLRGFIVWDSLERLVRKDFAFAPEAQEWHLVGDVLFQMKDDDKGRAAKFGANVRKTCLMRWPEHEVELTALFDWLSTNYTVEL